MNAPTCADLVERDLTDGRSHCCLPLYTSCNVDSDLLYRHRKLNCSTVTRDRRVKQPQTRNRSACDHCAKAKLRCSPSDPCSRCQKKNIPCVRKSGNSSTDSIDTDDMRPERPPHTHTDSIPEFGCQQDAQAAMAPMYLLVLCRRFHWAQVSLPKARGGSRPTDHGRKWRY